VQLERAHPCSGATRQGRSRAGLARLSQCTRLSSGGTGMVRRPVPGSATRERYVLGALEVAGSVVTRPSWPVRCSDCEDPVELAVQQPIRIYQIRYPARSRRSPTGWNASLGRKAQVMNGFPAQPVAASLPVFPLIAFPRIEVRERCRENGRLAPSLQQHVSSSSSRPSFSPPCSGYYASRYHR